MIDIYILRNDLHELLYVHSFTKRALFLTFLDVHGVITLLEAMSNEDLQTCMREWRLTFLTAQIFLKFISSSIPRKNLGGDRI